MASEDTSTPDDPTAKKAAAKKSTAKKAAAKKSTAKKAAAKKSTTKKAAAKKAAAKKSTAKKAAAKKATSGTPTGADAAAETPERPAAKKAAATTSTAKKAVAAVERPSLEVYVRDRGGDRVATLDLPAEWFDGEVNVPVMHQVVTAQLAAARQGTHKTRTRAEVAGGGRKPWRQKGTGRSRQGSIRSPQWVGGGVAHGRVPKDWSVRVNKKVKRAALRSALTDRHRSGAIRVVRDLAFDTPRTKDAVAALTAAEAAGRVLVVLADRHDATVRSLRNVPTVHLLVVDQLNTYDVLSSDVVVFEEAALGLIGTGRRAGSTVDEEVGA